MRAKRAVSFFQNIQNIQNFQEFSESCSNEHMTTYKPRKRCVSNFERSEMSAARHECGSIMINDVTVQFNG